MRAPSLINANPSSMHSFLDSPSVFSPCRVQLRPHSDVARPQLPVQEARATAAQPLRRSPTTASDLSTCQQHHLEVESSKRSRYVQGLAWQGLPQALVGLLQPPAWRPMLLLPCR